MNDELERTWQEACVNCYKTLYQDFVTWTMHFHMVNEIPTNASSSYILSYMFRRLKDNFELPEDGALRRRNM
jgi:hypothetical protein